MKHFCDFLFDLNNENKVQIQEEANKRYQEAPRRCLYEIFNCAIYRPNLIPLLSEIIKSIIIKENDKTQFIRILLKFITLRSSQPLKNAVLCLLYHCSLLNVFDYEQMESIANSYSSNPKVQERLIVDVFIWFLDRAKEEFKMSIFELSSNENKIQAMYPTIQNFFFNLESLSQNDFLMHKRLKNDDKTLKTVEAILKRDDSVLFQKVMNLPSFDISSTVQPSVYETNFLCNNGCPYASYCAFYGANKCLKMLIDAGVDLNQVDDANVTIAQFAAAGGNKEALETLLKGKVSYDGSAGFALKYHYLDLAKELMNQGSNKNLLHRAASSGYMEGIEYALSFEDPNSLNGNGRTALQVSCQFSENAAEKLIPITNVNVQDKEGMTALHFAVVNGLIDAVKLLLQNDKIDVSLSHRFGMNAILWAAHDGHLDIIKLLVEDGRSNIQSVDDEQWTPLHHAVMRNNVEILLYLISKGADVNAKQIEGMTPLHYAATMGFINSIEVLQRSPSIDMNPQDEGGLTPLLWAAQTNHVEAIQKLMEDPRTNPSIADNEHANILHWAAQGDLPVLSFIGTKVDVNSLDDNGMTPLLVATVNGSSSFVSDICEIEQTDVNIADNSGMTALHYAARDNNDMIITIIITTGRADVNKQNKNGMTPLHIAASNNHENAVMALLSAPGIKKDLKDEDGDTPLDNAKMFGYTNIVTLLQ